MSESLGTTFEEAKRCPKCERPGREVGSRKAKNGRGQPCTVHIIECATELCRWFGERYVVQVNDDGSIPSAYSSALSDKQYPRVSQESVSRIEENILKQIEVETKSDGHGEIRNPRG